MRVGLTGGIGAGKSAVAARLVEHGAVLIDSDVLAREVLAPGTPGLAAVLARFGPDVLGADGALDRAGLGRIVFADDAARADLNAIVHPLVRKRSAELAAAVPRGMVVVHDVPLLVETGQAGLYDVVVVVQADPDLRVARLGRHRGMDEQQARARIAAQATDAERRSVADVVLDNSGTRAELLVAVDRLFADLSAAAAEEAPG